MCNDHVDMVRIRFQVPAIGYIDYQVIRNDDEGIHGINGCARSFLVTWRTSTYLSLI